MKPKIIKKRKTAIKWNFHLEKETESELRIWLLKSQSRIQHKSLNSMSDSAREAIVDRSLKIIT